MLRGRRRLSHRVELTGGATAAAATGWALIAALQGGGSPLKATLPLVAFLTVAAAARVTVRQASLLLALVVMAPAAAALVSGSSLTGEGPLGYANASAALAFTSAAAALVLALRTTRRSIRYACFGIAAIWGLLPWIDHANAAALLVWLLPTAWTLRGRGATRRLAVAGAACLLAAMALTVAVGTSSQGAAGSGRIGAVVDTYLGQLRPKLWGDAIAAIRDRPLFGLGPGRFADVSSALHYDDAAAWTHNEYLQWTVETGLIGGLLLAAFIAWMIAVIARSSPTRGGALVAVAFGGLCIHATIDYIFHFPLIPVAVASLVGIVCGDHLHEGTERRSFPQRPRQGAAAFLALIWLLLVFPTTPLNPKHTSVNRVAWSAAGVGVEFTDGMIKSTAPREMYLRLLDAEAFTVEVLVAPASLDQRGPARIVSSSAGPGERNFTVGQDGDALVVRLRTSRADPNGTDREQRIPGVFHPGRPRHVAVVYGLDELRVYVDGDLRAHEESPAGSLASWQTSYPLLIGNELGGVRPWRGTVSHLAIHDTALPVETIASHSARAHLGRRQATIRSHVALYTFHEGQGQVIHDVSGAEPSLDLVMRPRMETIPESFAQAFFDVSAFSLAAQADVPTPLLPAPVLRVLGHALLFGALGYALRRAQASPNGTSRTWKLSLVGAAGFVLAAEYVQFSRAGSASVLDVATAWSSFALGLSLGTRRESANMTDDESAE